MHIDTQVGQLLHTGRNCQFIPRGRDGHLSITMKILTRGEPFVVIGLTLAFVDILSASGRGYVSNDSIRIQLF